MWELLRIASHTRVTSARSIFAYVLATLLAALLLVTVTPQTSLAAPATWNNESIVHNDNTYVGPVGSRAIEDLGLFEGTVAYTYVEPETASNRKIHVIYFAPGSDPGVADQANYRTYDYNGPEDYTNGSTVSPVELEPQVTTSVSSCQVEGGLGYILCPITNTLAGWMDTVFDILTEFLEVRPLEIEQDGAMFRIWSYMRNIANIAFVIAFLVIIYAQMTNFGIANYGIKKLLPRIIIAAILMNLSYLICAIAIDISNTLGHSLQDLFFALREMAIVDAEGNSWEAPSWSEITAFVLSGGGLAVAGGVLATVTVTSYGIVGSLALLLPALMTFLIAVLVALVVMAARQALITILTILAPLAFVAYLLPNTEKWFEKWRSIFMTMLVLFPAFSVIFGGSQLAGIIILQHAGGSIHVMILGMAVQVAPLFITPMLIKLSGTLISRIAGIVNNPNKGLIDRTRNWSKDRADNIKARRLGAPATPGALGMAQRAGQRMDHARRRREYNRKLNEVHGENAWLGSDSYGDLHHAMHDAEQTKKTIEARLDRDITAHVRLDKSALEKDLELRVTLDEASLEKNKLEKVHEELRAGQVPGRVPFSIGETLTNLADRQEQATRELAVTSIASQAAKRIQNSNLSDALLENTAMVDGKLLRDYAAGADIENGADSALSFAVAQKRKAQADLISERTQLIKQFKLNGGQRQQLAMGESVDATTTIGGKQFTYTFDKNDEYVREAAIEEQLKKGAFPEIMKIIEASGEGQPLYEFRTTISDAIPNNSLPGKGGFLAGQFIDLVGKGEIKGRDSVINATVSYLQKGKVKPEVLASNDADALPYITDAIAHGLSTITSAAERQAFINNIGGLRQSALAIVEPKAKKVYSSELNSKASSVMVERLKKLLENTEAYKLPTESDLFED